MFHRAVKAIWQEVGRGIICTSVWLILWIDSARLFWVNRYLVQRTVIMRSNRRQLRDEMLDSRPRTWPVLANAAPHGGSCGGSPSQPGQTRLMMDRSEPWRVKLLHLRPATGSIESSSPRYPYASPALYCIPLPSRHLVSSRTDLRDTYQSPLIIASANLGCTFTLARVHAVHRNTPQPLLVHHICILYQLILSSTSPGQHIYPLVQLWKRDAAVSQ